MVIEQESDRSLSSWNDTVREYPQDKCIHQLFEEQVQKTPDAVAVVFAEKQLTYRELNTKANQLARHLQGLGVGPEVLVGLCVERSLEMVVAMLGILKAGGAYVPLDPAYPKERLAFMKEDVALSIVVTQEKLKSDLTSPPLFKGGWGGSPSLKLVSLDNDSEKISQQSRENPESKVSSENLAYVIYTSGSTGKPKGVQTTHRSVVNLLNSLYSRPTVQSSRGGKEFFEVGVELTQKLKRLSREEGVTLFMTLLAGFGTLLYRYSGQEDIVVGTPIANRSEIEGLIGFFVNTLVLRTRLEGNPKFTELLQQVRQTALDAYAHQDVPFEQLVKALQPERS